MSEKIDNQSSKIDLNTTYPIHYHGYIHMYDSNTSVSDESTLNQLIKQYGENADELGIG